jgi:predicted transcriptional regulator of viral defense system
VSSAVRAWVEALPARGQNSFDTPTIARAFPGHSANALYLALHRLERDGVVVSPVRSFWVVVPLEDRLRAAPGWRLYLDGLMRFLEVPYYVGLLSAAAHHGAAAQSAQRLQVMVPQARRQIVVGGQAIEFLIRKQLETAPVEDVRTPSGTVRIATAEMAAFDLVRYPLRGGGWGNVATVLRDLAPQLTREPMRAALKSRPTQTELRRLGALLDRLGGERVTDILFDALTPGRSNFIPLVPRLPAEGARDPRWKIVLNTSIEPD